MEEDGIQLFAGPARKKQKPASHTQPPDRCSLQAAGTCEAARRRKAGAPAPTQPSPSSLTKLKSKAPKPSKAAEEQEVEALLDEAGLRSRGEASTSTAPSAVSSSHDPSATFKSLGCTDWLCSVCGSLGMLTPTAVQQGCIPAVLAGRDVIGLAQTGSGKTAAFALPILQALARDPFGVFALVLTPTRWVGGVRVGSGGEVGG